MRRKITAWSIVGIFLLVLAVVLAISWFFIPGWKGLSGGVWVLLGLALTGVFSVLNDLFGILETLGLVGKKNATGENAKNIQGPKY